MRLRIARRGGILRSGQCISLLLPALFLVSTVAAGTLYLDGKPEISVHLAGANEFSPGANASISLVIENSGLNRYKFIQSSLVDREDLPNTAKSLRVSLAGGDTPLAIKTGPQMAGDLAGGSRVTAVFSAKVSPDAVAGTYPLAVYLNYSYLYAAEQYAADSLRYYYRASNLTLYVPVTIRPVVSIAVIAADPEHLYAGSSGYITLRLQNTGAGTGKETVVSLLRSGDSPIIPMEGSLLVGDFPPSSVSGGRFRVSLSSGAERGLYPVEVVVAYKDEDGDTVTLPAETIGVPVGGKTGFAVVSPPAQIHPGKEGDIIVEYQNRGDARVFGAEARISAEDPFSGTGDLAWIGDLDPYESSRVSFRLTVDRRATAKEYGLDSVILYHDALDNPSVSDTMKVRILVTGESGPAIVLSDPVRMTVILAILAGIAVYGFRCLKKQR